MAPNMDGWKRSVEAEIDRFRAEEIERVGAEPADERPVKAWEEKRDDMVRMLRARAAEHDRIADMGAQDAEPWVSRLRATGHPTYRQQAAAERALADQIKALSVPALGGGSA